MAQVGDEGSAGLRPVHAGGQRPAIVWRLRTPAPWRSRWRARPRARTRPRGPGSAARPRSPSSQSPGGMLKSAWVSPFVGSRAAISAAFEVVGEEELDALEAGGSAAAAKRSRNGCSWNIMLRLAAKRGIVPPPCPLVPGGPGAYRPASTAAATPEMPDETPATAPRTWLLMGRKVGDNAQLLALAEALGWPFEEKRFVYRSTELLNNRLLGPNLTASCRRARTRWSRPGRSCDHGGAAERAGGAVDPAAGGGPGQGQAGPDGAALGAARRVRPDRDDAAVRAAAGRPTCCITRRRCTG